MISNVRLTTPGPEGGEKPPSLLRGTVTIFPWIKVAMDHMVDYELIAPDGPSDGR